MSTCPDCKNNFAQPFKCVTCGAEKLYDATLEAAKVELAALRTKLVEAERKLAEHMAQPCCQEWHTCERACLPRAENWKVAAEEAERKLAEARREFMLLPVLPDALKREHMEEAANVGLAQESHDLQQICRNAYEVWAGSEGIPIPQTAAEAYLLSLLEQMRDEVKRGLK